MNKIVALSILGFWIVSAFMYAAFGLYWWVDDAELVSFRQLVLIVFHVAGILFPSLYLVHGRD